MATLFVGAVMVRDKLNQREKVESLILANESRTDANQAWADAQAVFLRTKEIFSKFRGQTEPVAPIVCAAERPERFLYGRPISSYETWYAEQIKAVQERAERHKRF